MQRVIHSLQVTDAGRDARVQQIGERATDSAGSGKLEKAELYREAIEAELDASPVASKSERDLVLDSVNTIGQIFANYQAALHMFEDAIGTGMGEAVPQELAKEILREGARDVLEPVFAAASETAGELGDQVGKSIGTPDQVRKDKPRASRHERARLRPHEPRGGRANADRPPADEAAQGPGLVRRARRDARRRRRRRRSASSSSAPISCSTRWRRRRTAPRASTRR